MSNIKLTAFLHSDPSERIDLNLMENLILGLLKLICITTGVDNSGP